VSGAIHVYEKYMAQSRDKRCHVQQKNLPKARFSADDRTASRGLRGMFGIAAWLLLVL
jgi:hypothetical protein